MKLRNILENQTIKKSQKILNVCFFSHWANLGGAERALLELVIELIEDYGVTCTVVLPSDGPLREKLEQAGASTRIIDYSWWYDPEILSDEKVKEVCLNSAKNLFYNLKEALRRINPDIVFTNTMSIPWGAIAASFLGKPHIWFIHEFGESDHGLKLFLPLNLTLKVIKDLSTIILTNSEAVRKELFPDIGEEKALTIYQRINISPTTLYQKEDKYFLRKHSAKLIISATVQQEKGQKDAVLAVKELLQRGKDVELIVMGWCISQYAEHLKIMVDQENLKEHIKFIGFKENPYPIMNQATIVLSCSRKEAFGRVAAEAMLLKKPVIGTNRGGTPELIKEEFNGLLYEPGNYNQLADKIEYLINNPNKAKELVNNGYEFVKKTFTKNNFGGKIYQLLLDLKQKAGPETSFSGLILEGPALLDSLLAATTSKDKKIAALITELGSSLRVRDSQITELTNGLQNRDTQIAALEDSLQKKESQIAERDSQIAERGSQIAERDSQIAERGSQIAERGSQIARLQNVLQEKEAQISEKEIQINSLEFQIQQIQQSILMQLAKRYDRVIKRLLPLGTRRRHYYELGLIGIRVILNEGWRIFWTQFKGWLRQKMAERKKTKVPPLTADTGDDWSNYGILSQKIAEIKMQNPEKFSPKSPKWQEQIDTLNQVRLIAFYFPQYHPIPENDRFWGKGFTEWTMVKKARPNFVGHYQPRIPTNLGYYDLNNIETMERQAELAKKYGIYGFCYYYYWFDGKRVMGMPLERILKTGKPDIPFCLCWANENWTRRWDGQDDLVMLKQRHSDKDDRAVIRDLMRYMRHPNYIRINGKPLLLIYRVGVFPNIKRTTEIWRDLCHKEGIGDIYLTMCETFEHANGNIPPSKYGFDASVEFPPHADFINFIKPPGEMLNPHFRGIICDYREAVLRRAQKDVPNYTWFRAVIPAWDNTARRQNNSCLFVYSSPGAYQAWLETMLNFTLEHNSDDERLIFINAWNEWGEGAYLEPDQRYGHKFLEATRRAMEAASKSTILKPELLRKISDKINQGGTIQKKKSAEISKQGIICLHPFTLMNFSINGNVWNCQCRAWVKHSLGNIKKNSIAEIWNSNTARWIRRKMYDGEWQDICDPACYTLVNYLRFNKFNKYEELEKNELLSPELIEEIKTRKDCLKSPPVFFQPDVDNACNLRCIMCGTRESRSDPSLQKKLWADLKQYLPTAKIFALTGWGDPFARPDTRELLINYKGPARFRITTNGLLLPRYWEQIKHQKFDSLDISIDAATKTTYEKIRVGGKWEDLLKALDLVKQNKDKLGYVSINMTVMRSNYKEIPQFIDLAESYGFDCSFHAMQSSWGNENIFELNDTKALDELRNIITNENSKKRPINIRWLNLSHFLDLNLSVYG